MDKTMCLNHRGEVHVQTRMFTIIALAISTSLCAVAAVSFCRTNIFNNKRQNNIILLMGIAAILWNIMSLGYSISTDARYYNMFVLKIVLANCVMFLLALPDTLLPLFHIPSYPSSGIGVTIAFVVAQDKDIVQHMFCCFQRCLWGQLWCCGYDYRCNIRRKGAGTEPYS